MTDSHALHAAIKRVEAAANPLEALERVGDVRAELSRWEAMQARAALSDGASWADVGAAVGTSRQAAWERLRPTIKALIDEDRRSVEEAKARARRKHREHADG